MKIDCAKFDKVLRCLNINFTFREALRLVFTQAELKEYSPTDRKLAKWLVHKVNYIKLFCIKMHNNWTKSHSASGIWDNHLISQIKLDGTLIDLTQVYHSLKSEER